MAKKSPKVRHYTVSDHHVIVFTKQEPASGLVRKAATPNINGEESIMSVLEISIMVWRALSVEKTMSYKGIISEETL